MTDIRVPVCTRVSCTDTTPQRGGAVVCIVSSSIADASYESTEVRGARVFLERFSISLIPEHEQVMEPDPIVAEVAKCSPWYVARNLSFPETQHINLQDTVEVLTELQHACARSMLLGRLGNLADLRA